VRNGRCNVLPEKEWLFRLEDGEHRIHLKHGSFIRKYNVELDDHTIDLIRTIIERGDKLEFNINLHKCVLIIRTIKGGFNYDCIIDGTSIQTHQKSEIPPEWNQPKRGCLTELFSYIIFAIVIGIVSGLTGFSSDKIIGLAVGAIVLYAVLRYLIKRRL